MNNNGGLYPSSSLIIIINTIFAFVLCSYTGTNKVAFLISNYRHPTSVHSSASSLISLSLKTRLYNQEALKMYLDSDQVLSWVDAPAALHLEQLRKLTELERNPRTLFEQSCVCL